MKIKTLPLRSIFLILLPLLLVSCTSSNPKQRPPAKAPEQPRAAASKHPAVIILDFENRSGFRGSWNLERQVPDNLHNKLYPTGKLTLLDRSLFNTVAGQLARGGNAGPNNAGGDLQRADYAVSGTITDFRSMRDRSGLFGPTLQNEVQDELACSINLIIRIADVQSGHLIEQFDRKYTLRANPNEDPVDYRSLDFGSELFSYTPLGRVTDALLDDVSSEVIKVIRKDQSKGRKRKGLTAYRPDSSRAPGSRATAASITPPPINTEIALPPPPPRTPKTSAVNKPTGKITVIGKEGSLWVVDAGAKNNIRPGNHALARTYDGSKMVVSGLLSIRAVRSNRATASLIEGSVEKGSVLEIID